MTGVQFRGRALDEKPCLILLGITREKNEEEEEKVVGCGGGR